MLIGNSRLRNMETKSSPFGHSFSAPGSKVSATHCRSFYLFLEKISPSSFWLPEVSQRKNVSHKLLERLQLRILVLVYRDFVVAGSIVGNRVTVEAYSQWLVGISCCYCGLQS